VQGKWEHLRAPLDVRCSAAGGLLAARLLCVLRDDLLPHEANAIREMRIEITAYSTSCSECSTIGLQSATGGLCFVGAPHSAGLGCDMHKHGSACRDHGNGE